MSERLESVLSVDNRDGLVLDTPEQMANAKVLSTRMTIKILQILNAKLNEKSQRSWWSVGALRQLTYTDTRSLKLILKSLSTLGLIDLVEVKNVPRFSVSKKSVHGLIPMDKSTLQRKRYIGKDFICRLQSDFIDLEFTQKHDRTLFIPAEGIHLQNLEIFKSLFKTRTMIILQAIGNADGPISSNQITDYLNSYFNRNSDEEKVIKYDLKDLLQLTRKSFVDGFSNTISSNHRKYKDSWTLVNKDNINKVGNYQSIVSLLYELNYDRIRLYFTNKQGEEIQNKQKDLHYPETSDIMSSTQETEKNIISQGVIVDII